MDEKKVTMDSPNENAITSHSITSRDQNEIEVFAEIDGALTSPLCRKDCKICNSDHLEEIHSMLDANLIYVKICEHLLNDYNFSISPSSITRHYSNFKQYKRTTINRKFLKKMDSITDNLARDKAQASFLGGLVFKSILHRIEMGTIEFDISDLEKIKKLEYGILNGNTGSIDNLLGIFALASKKYNAPLEQGSLNI